MHRGVKRRSQSVKRWPHNNKFNIVPEVRMSSLSKRVAVSITHRTRCSCRRCCRCYRSYCPSCGQAADSLLAAGTSHCKTTQLPQQKTKMLPAMLQCLATLPAPAAALQHSGAIAAALHGWSQRCCQQPCSNSSAHSSTPHSSQACQQCPAAAVL